MRPVVRTGGAVAALSLGLAVVPAIPAYAAVVRVGCDVKELRGAIDTANGAGGGTIELAPKCTYTLTDANTVGSQNGFPNITADITLKGGKHTVIERSTAPGTPQFRFFEVNDPNGELTLNRLTLRNGSADFGGAVLVWGALAVEYGPATFSHSKVNGNTATGQSDGGGGGGVALIDATATFEFTHVSRNKAAGERADGGGIVDSGNSIINLRSSWVSGNSAADQGGGILSERELNVRRGGVQDNSAGSQGGGVWSGGTTLLDGTELKGNRTTAVGSLGGGLFTGRGTATLNRSWVIENRADGTSGNGGGIYEQPGSTVTIDQTNVAHNHPNNCAPPAPSSAA